MKATLSQLFTSTLEQLSLDKVMPGKLAVNGGVLQIGEERVQLAAFRKVIIVAIGKAAYQMAEQTAEILKPHTVSGMIVTSALPGGRLTNFMTYEGGHPYPNEQSAWSANVAQELLSDLKPDYLVLYLLSGGGSAIFERPISDEISLDDSREFFRLLVTCGANIVEMNVLRKHFSAVKGGRLAEIAHPAKQLTLYVSDVPADQPSTVASGPTMPDESTVEDCYEIVERLKLKEGLPGSLRAMFDKRTIPETPKPGSEKFANSSWHCLLGNQDGLDTLVSGSRMQGWVVDTDLSVDDWPLEKAVDHLLSRLATLRQENPGKTAAILTGGELSCPVTGDGMGGRNQAFVLSCARRIAGQNIAVVSAGTDGIDGNSPAAGAVADGHTIERARALGMDAADFEQRSDSYHFFGKLGDLLMTGPTGNNIRDLRALVAW
jgi:glycerate 2-kinase